MDLRLKNGDGLELIKSLKAQIPHLRILVLSQYEAPEYAERALRAGAMGYVMKQEPADEVLNAIRTVLAGEVYLTRGMAGVFLRKLMVMAPKAISQGVKDLTDRELHVLALLGTGLSTREIAAELKRSVKTVETHRENIKQALSLQNAAELIHYATEWANEQIFLTPKILAAPIITSAA
jgi:DNA-binding NarL/FixJ family response regulator